MELVLPFFFLTRIPDDSDTPPPSLRIPVLFSTLRCMLESLEEFKKNKDARGSTLDPVGWTLSGRVWALVFSNR